MMSMSELKFKAVMMHRTLASKAWWAARLTTLNLFDSRTRTRLPNTFAENRIRDLFYRRGF